MRCGVTVRFYLSVKIEKNNPELSDTPCVLGGERWKSECPSPRASLQDTQLRLWTRNSTSLGPRSSQEGWGPGRNPHALSPGRRTSGRLRRVLCDPPRGPVPSRLLCFHVPVPAAPGVPSREHWLHPRPGLPPGDPDGDAAPPSRANWGTAPPAPQPGSCFLGRVPLELLWGSGALAPETEDGPRVPGDWAKRVTVRTLMTKNGVCYPPADGGGGVGGARPRGSVRLRVRNGAGQHRAAGGGGSGGCSEGSPGEGSEGGLGAWAERGWRCVVPGPGRSGGQTGRLGDPGPGCSAA